MTIKEHNKHDILVLIFILTFIFLNILSSPLLSKVFFISNDQKDVNLIKTSNTSLKIVTTLTIIEDVVENIVGKDVPVIVSGTEDPHSYEPTSSEISALADADVIFRMGVASLEPWWRTDWEDAIVISLIEPGMLKVDPLLGFKNPHVWMDPNNVKNFTLRVNETLCSLEPIQANRLIFSNNTSNFINILDNLTNEIINARKNFIGLKVVVSHPAFFYFFSENLLNITRVAAIEKGEGKEPSAIDIANVIRLMEREDCHLIVTNPQHSLENVYEIARETNSRIALLTPLLNVVVNWNGKTMSIDTYKGLIEYDLWALAHPIEVPEVIELWGVFLVLIVLILVVLIIFIYIRKKPKE
ncbi:MAG: metal ABC transporter substrate-binding protein [Promethearchaeota archaeon]